VLGPSTSKLKTPPRECVLQQEMEGGKGGEKGENRMNHHLFTSTAPDKGAPFSIGWRGGGKAPAYLTNEDQKLLSSPLSEVRGKGSRGKGEWNISISFLEGG